MNFNNNKNEEFNDTNHNSESNSNGTDIFWQLYNCCGCCLCILSIIGAYYICNKSCDLQGNITKCSILEAVFHFLAACCCYSCYFPYFLMRVFLIRDIKFDCVPPTA